MAESTVTETASPDKQPNPTGQAKKTIQTKGNVVIFAMDGSDIAINALKCEFLYTITFPFQFFFVSKIQLSTSCSKTKERANCIIMMA